MSNVNVIQGCPNPVLRDCDPAGFSVRSQVNTVCLVGQKTWLGHVPRGLGSNTSKFEFIAKIKTSEK